MRQCPHNCTPYQIMYKKFFYKGADIVRTYNLSVGNRDTPNCFAVLFSDGATIAANLIFLRFGLDACS